MAFPGGFRVLGRARLLEEPLQGLHVLLREAGALSVGLCGRPHVKPQCGVGGGDGFPKMGTLLLGVPVKMTQAFWWYRKRVYFRNSWSLLRT